MKIYVTLQICFCPDGRQWYNLIGAFYSPEERAEGFKKYISSHKLVLEEGDEDYADSYHGEDESVSYFQFKDIEVSESQKGASHV